MECFRELRTKSKRSTRLQITNSITRIKHCEQNGDNADKQIDNRRNGTNDYKKRINLLRQIDASRLLLAVIQ